MKNSIQLNLSIVAILLILAAVTVVIQLTGAPTEVAQPAHIHPGTCTDLNPVPQYPLNDVKNGVSNTLVDAKLSDLLSGDFSINVHKSVQEISTYVACGSIR